MTENLSPARSGAFVYALALIAVAGAVDAVGFLQFRTFYVSFMSGNTTRIAIAISERDFALVLHGSAIVTSFMVGVIVGDLVTGVPPRRRGITLLIEAASLVFALALPSPSWSSLPLAFAMGLHNALVLRAEHISVSLTYVTGTLVHIGRAIAAKVARRGPPVIAWPYAVSWLTLLIGAAAGAALFDALGRSALIPMAGALFVLACGTIFLEEKSS